MQLRPYQIDFKSRIYEAWKHVSFVLGVMPTGAGKTVSFSDIILEHVGVSCAIAHRQELVSQISLALARDQVRHTIIGPKEVVKLCVKLHMGELGMSYYDPAARCSVAGIDTLMSRKDTLSEWAKTVTLWVMDEAHHVVNDNKWGNGTLMFPNAKGLGVTATPTRADGKGLGAHADGVFQALIVGPTMRWLINNGYLTEYRIFAPPSDFVRPEGLGSNGDFTQKNMVSALAKSHVMGDVVSHYLKIAPGKLGITFVPNVATAEDECARFIAAGVPAAVVTAKTPTAERFKILRMFKNREYLQLVNVDLFGEGFDLPAIEVVSFARPTESYALFVQQFGRALRLLEGKEMAIIIDHVGNVARHGLPDTERVWTLDGRNKRQRLEDDNIPVKTCPACFSVYERIHKACPFCGMQSIPQDRSGPDQVDGDLQEMSYELLAQLRGEIEKVDRSKEDYRAELAAKHAPAIGQMAHVKRHVERQQAQADLRASIALWAGYQRFLQRPDSESYRRFYFKFGLDVLSAQALNTKDALELKVKVDEHIAGGGI